MAKRICEECKKYCEDCSAIKFDDFVKGKNLGRKQALEEVEKILDEYEPSTWNLMYDQVIEELKQKLLGGKDD